MRITKIEKTFGSSLKNKKRNNISLNQSLKDANKLASETLSYEEIQHQEILKVLNRK